MGLASIWFTVEAIKRIDGRGDAMVRPHVRALKARLAETNARLGDLENRLSRVEDRMVATRMESRAARDLAEETRSIRHNLQRSRAAYENVQSYHA
ncbi:MAG: hypothetical protein OXR84_00645 [Magnetovibrio sp.]|nr:hypothetical protein [Magnetovibrio sp.]